MSNFKIIFYSLFWLQGLIFFISIFSLDIEFNGGFDIAIKYLLIPNLILITFTFLIFKENVNKDLKLDNNFKIIFSIIFTTVWNTGLGGVGCVNIMNCNFGNQINIKGKMKIVNKYTESSKGSNSYKFDYIYNERKFTFFVSKKLYNQKNIGDTTDEEIKIGSLGIVYKLR